MQARLILALLALLCLSASAATHKHRSQKALVKTKTKDGPPALHLWTLQQSSGDTVKNVGSSKGTPGVLTNAAWQKDKQAGDVVYINGAANSYVNFGNVLSQVGQAPFTVGVWLKTNYNVNAFAQVFSTRSTACPPCHGNFMELATFGSVGGLEIGIDQDTSATNYAIARTYQGFPDSDWHYYIYTRLGTTITLYIDGYAATSANSAAPTVMSTGAPFTIGASSPGAYASVPGLYARVAIWDSALSPSDALLTYKASRKVLLGY